MRNTLPLIAAGVMLAMSATAADRTGFYIGGDLGEADWGVNHNDAESFGYATAGDIEDYAPGLTVDLFNNKGNDTDFSYSLFVGYQFVPWLAAELTWLDLGTANVKSQGTYNAEFTINPPPLPGIEYTGQFTSRAKASSSGGALSLLPMWPIGNWDLYGRLGYYWGTSKLNTKFNAQNYDVDGVAVGNGYQYGDNNSGNVSSFLWGLGVQYTMDRRVSFRAEYGQADGVEFKTPWGTPSQDVARYTFGIVYRFGEDEVAPAPVAAAPVAAAPVAAAKCADSDKDGVCDTADKCPNTPAGERVGPNGCSCDVVIRTHFAFDSAELTAEDKATLDKAAARLKELQFVEGTATGYTDNAGEEAYNQKLSERRAQAVVDYLGAQGVAMGRIKAIGMGEAKPIASNDTEEGRAQNRRVTIRRTDCGPAN